MIYPPLIAFFLAIAWMIWRAKEAKKEYVRHKAELAQVAAQEMEQRARVFYEAYQIRLPGERRQGEVPAVAEALGRTAQQQSGGSKWNQ
jgi:hypothetical protein